jgi:hypothetical protein
MRTIAAIKERLDQNARERSILDHHNLDLPKTGQIHLEYLRIEAETYNGMLDTVRNRRWSIFRNRKFLLLLAIISMSVYVLGVFYMFRGLDLTQVAQWEIAVTALPFWMILTVVPLAAIAFLTTRNTRV